MAVRRRALGARRAAAASPKSGPTRSNRAVVAAAPQTRTHLPDPPIAEPTERPLKVYAFDPSTGDLLGNNMVVTVPYEPLKPGPIGRRFAVIDYDAANNTYYAPVDLDSKKLLIRGGLDPSESDPRFHQQMVYAVATETLKRFETALGRRVHWRRPERDAITGKIIPSDGIHRLNLYPHAMFQANAFYSPAAQGILFGYFRASTTNPGANLPGQTVFTCLSHDIIAHETTHAIIDGIRKYLTEPTNIDVPAWNEAFADLVALFRHFSHKEALYDTLQRTGGRLYQFQLVPEAGRARRRPSIQAEMSAQNPLIQLAQQFGGASGMRAGLRSALGTPPNSRDIDVKTEPHDRGAILVAAVFDAYFTVYTRRTANLYRVFRAGGGSADPVDLPGPLADLLAAEASRTAEKFFLICVRALDYMPPVNITFGDFLRAIITADMDLNPQDPDGVRDAFMQAFRLRGIIADSAKFFSDESLCWPRASDDLPAVKGLVFGDPNGLTKAEQDDNAEVLKAYAKANAVELGFDPANTEPIKAPSFHPVFRVASDGSLAIDMVVELVQTRMVGNKDEPGLRQFPLRGGVTLLIAQQRLQTGKRADPKIRYVIPKHLTPDLERRQLAYYSKTGLAEVADDEHRFQINFGLVHAGM